MQRFRPPLSTPNFQPSTFPEGRQIQAGCTCLENRIGIAEVGALPTPSASEFPSQRSTIKHGFIMKQVLRYQSQMLFRKNYKPNRILRIRPAVRMKLVFRPVNRFGVKPKLEIVP